MTDKVNEANTSLDNKLDSRIAGNVHSYFGSEKWYTAQDYEFVICISFSKVTCSFTRLISFNIKFQVMTSLLRYFQFYQYLKGEASLMLNCVASIIIYRLLFNFWRDHKMFSTIQFTYLIHMNFTRNTTGASLNESFNILKFIASSFIDI